MQPERQCHTQLRRNQPLTPPAKESIFLPASISNVNYSWTDAAEAAFQSQKLSPFKVDFMTRDFLADPPLTLDISV